MNLKLTLDKLSIEVTRKCNMSCSHCYRGKSQNVSMNVKHFEKLSEKISHINTILFTGGEPFLVPYVIDSILEICKRNDISVNNFHIRTNGSIFTILCGEIIENWYRYCLLADTSIIEITKENQNSILFKLYKFSTLNPIISMPDLYISDNSIYGNLCLSLSGNLYSNDIWTYKILDDMTHNSFICSVSDFNYQFVVSNFEIRRKYG